MTLSLMSVCLSVWSVCGLCMCGLLCLVCVSVGKDKRSVGVVQCDTVTTVSLSVCGLCVVCLCGLLCLACVGVGKDRKSVGAAQCDTVTTVSVCLWSL